MKKKKIKIIIIILSLLIFILSLSQNAMKTSEVDGIKYFSSISTFVSGGFGILGGAFYEWLIWLANPVFFVAIILLIKEKKKSIYLGIIAIITGLYFTTWEEILANEGGRKVPIISLELGYWLWIISMIVFTIGAIIYFSAYKKDSSRLNIKN